MVRGLLGVIVAAAISSGCATSSALARREVVRQALDHEAQCRAGGSCGGYGEVEWGQHSAEVVARTGCVLERASCTRQALLEGKPIHETYGFTDDRLSQVAVTFEQPMPASYESVVVALSKSLGRPDAQRDPEKELRQALQQEQVFSLFVPVGPHPWAWSPWSLGLSRVVAAASERTQDRCSAWTRQLSQVEVCADARGESRVLFTSEVFKPPLARDAQARAFDTLDSWQAVRQLSLK